MFGIGMQEVAIILLVALVFIGPDKLPKVAKTLGKGMRELRRASDDIRSTIMLEDEEPYRAPPPPRRVPSSDEAPAAIAGSLLAGEGDVEDADYSDVPSDDEHNPDGTLKSASNANSEDKEGESAGGAPPIGTVGRGGSAVAVTAAGMASQHQPDPDDANDHTGMPDLDGPEVQEALAHAKKLAQERNAQGQDDAAEETA